MSPSHRKNGDEQTEPLELDTVRVPRPAIGSMTVAVLKPRTLPRLVLLFAFAVALVAFTSYSAAWLAYQQSNRTTRQQIGELNDDLTSRRAARAEMDRRNAEQQARTVEQQERFRRYACALAEAAASPGPEIRQMRTDLLCDYATLPPGYLTSPTPTPHGGPTSSAPAGRGGGAVPSVVRPPASVPHPAPPPPRSTAATPRPSSSTSDPLIGCVTLPLTGRVCV